MPELWTPGMIGPQELIVPLGAIRQLTLSRAEPESPIGFSLPSG